MNEQEISQWHELATLYGTEFGVKILAAML
jgi:hypothetical protein